MANNYFGPAMATTALGNALGGIFTGLLDAEKQVPEYEKLQTGITSQRNQEQAALAQLPLILQEAKSKMNLTGAQIEQAIANAEYSRAHGRYLTEDLGEKQRAIAEERTQKAQLHSEEQTRRAGFEKETANLGPLTTENAPQYMAAYAKWQQDPKQLGYTLSQLVKPQTPIKDPTSVTEAFWRLMKKKDSGLDLSADETKWMNDQAATMQAKKALADAQATTARSQGRLAEATADLQIAKKQWGPRGITDKSVLTAAQKQTALNAVDRIANTNINQAFKSMFGTDFSSIGSNPKERADAINWFRRYYKNQILAERNLTELMEDPAKIEASMPATLKEILNPTASSWGVGNALSGVKNWFVGSKPALPPGVTIELDEDDDEEPGK